LPGSARADPLPTNVFVHVDSPERVDLARQTEPEGEFTVVCAAPCDRSLPSSGVYRIQSSQTDGSQAIRDSNDIALSPFDARQALVVEPKSPVAFGFGLGLVIVGGNALGAAAFLAMLNAILAEGGPVDQSGPAVLAGAGAFAVAMGVVLIADNRHSRVTVNKQELRPAKRDPTVARPRAESARYPAPVTMPLFRISF